MSQEAYSCDIFVEICLSAISFLRRGQVGHALGTEQLLREGNVACMPIAPLLQYGPHRSRNMFLLQLVLSFCPGSLGGPCVHTDVPGFVLDSVLPIQSER